jgi:DNA-binding NtrC family response regulator
MARKLDSSRTHIKEARVWTIFVLDDDPALTKVLAEELSGRHRLVRIFSDPLRALDALARERPDLLITDLSLPWVDGKAVVARARERYPDLRVLLMSGYRRGADIAASEHIGFLAKPIDLDGLLTAVEDALAVPQLPIPKEERAWS